VSGTTIPAAVAAGHPATTAVGVEILAEGGTAADAAIAATLASCVAETVMTGLLGGGHGIYFDARRGRVQLLDCFVAVPGLGRTDTARELVHLDVPFGEELVHYAVGPASCAVPGVPAGLDVLWREHGRLPWRRLVDPALRLAREGVDFPPAHAACLAMLAPVMTMDAGRRIYAPGGKLLAAGERLQQPGLVRALELVAEEGATSVYEGTIADALLEVSDERGGILTARDLSEYEARWEEPLAVDYQEWTLLTRGGLAGIRETAPTLPRLRDLDETERVLALVESLRTGSGSGHTTNLAVADALGNACVLTTSLGLGSGDFLPGLDLHLNSMLGELDLIRGPVAAGERMESMMAPLVVCADGEPVLAAGAAGGTRLRTALLTTLAGILDLALAVEAAVARPRFHATATSVNAEPGVDERALRTLETRGWNVRRWPSLHHYFGGVSLVSLWGAAADPRRDGAAATVL
jgi:gamma-glutamyltranspeptidase/glutathione hydrolase